jgi:ring-1,2-phenylacetyl-CoA epoxidase subunit PaaD
VNVEQAWAVLHTVPDPEVPALSLTDLGIVRDVRADHPGLEVVLTPTYSGCPATEVISQSVVDALDAAGLGPVRITMQRAPAWTTDWMSEAGKAKLTAYGIAPPTHRAGERSGPIPVMLGVKCPRCQSLRTREVSRFGSTACKSHFECLACLEPFDHFKVH